MTISIRLRSMSFVLLPPPAAAALHCRAVEEAFITYNWPSLTVAEMKVCGFISYM